MKKVIISAIKFYQTFLSSAFVPILGFGCKQIPSCSEYAIKAVDKYGAARGVKLATRRVLHCH